jgi:hypothetical protein
MRVYKGFMSAGILDVSEFRFCGASEKNETELAERN